MFLLLQPSRVPLQVQVCCPADKEKANYGVTALAWSFTLFIPRQMSWGLPGTLLNNSLRQSVFVYPHPLGILNANGDFT